MDIHKEKQSIERAKHEPEAFGLIFDEYYPQIYRYCVRRTGDIIIAQDVCAETFTKAFQNIHKFVWRDVSISSWLYKIATNEIRTHYRRGAHPVASLDELYELDGFEPVDAQDIHQELVDAQDAVQRQHDFVIAQQLLSRMPIKYQEVIVLRFTEGKKLSEIATILGKKEGTIKSLLSRALAKLRLDMQTTKMQPSVHTGVVDSERNQTIKSLEGLYET